MKKGIEAAEDNKESIKGDVDRVFITQVAAIS